MIHYIVISENYSDQLEKKVNEKLEEGYVLQGNLVVTVQGQAGNYHDKIVFTQVLTKLEP